MKKLLLVSLICPALLADVTLVSPLQRNDQSTATELLTLGIVTSSPVMVAEALKKGAHLRVQLDQFGDTPLMLAIRIFGHSLRGQLEEKNNRASRIGVMAAGMFIGQLVLSQASKLVPDEWQTAFNVFNLAAVAAPAAYTVRQALKPAAVSQRAARVILLLLQRDVQSDLRNSESLAPKDILEAFYPVAKVIQNEEWFTLRRIFSQISPN